MHYLGWIILGLFVGLIIGKYITEYNWRLTAKGESGHFSGGKIYHVIEEEDSDKWEMWFRIKKTAPFGTSAKTIGRGNPVKVSGNEMPMPKREGFI